MTKEINNLKNEIDRFFKLIEYLDSLLINNPISEIDIFSIHIIDKDNTEAIFKMMKSNIMIMLYNLVESCVRNTMYEYYDRFNNKKASYTETIVQLKKLWIKENSKDIRENNIVEKIFNMIENSINREYKISLDFDKSFYLSGNADLRQIKSILNKHGLYFEEERLSLSGGALKPIKDMRNNLAHGNISFEKNGQHLSIRDIKDYKDKTYECLDYFIEIVTQNNL